MDGVSTNNNNSAKKRRGPPKPNLAQIKEETTKLLGLLSDKDYQQVMKESTGIEKESQIATTVNKWEKLSEVKVLVRYFQSSKL